MNLHFFAIKIKLLIISGDVENNPGPYQLIKSIQGTFNQGNISLFGNTAGKQCSCIALFSLFWCHIKQVSRWDSLDLDNILISGDKLYKSLNKNYYLNVDELPREIIIYERTVSVDLESNNLHDGIAVNGDSFLQDIFVNNNNQRLGGLLFICSYVVAIIPRKDRFGNVASYFLFDSHCRNSRGVTDSENGFSVLLEFQNLSSIERYIDVAYNLASRSIPPYFQLQFVNIQISLGTILHIKSVARRERKSRKRSSKECVSQNHKVNEMPLNNYFKSSATISSITNKKKSTVKSEVKNFKKPAKSTLSTNIISFQNQVYDGPYYVCVICNRTLYRRSVVLFVKKKYLIEHIDKMYLVSSFDNCMYICKTCDGRMKNGMIPCQAVSNKLELYDFPAELRYVNKLEKVLIAKRILFKKVAIMPKGQFPKLKGSICNIPIDTVSISQTLPNPSHSNGVTVVKLKKKMEFKGHVFFESVRPQIIVRLLQYLKVNNELYYNISIDVSHIPPSFFINTDVEENVVFFNDKNKTVALNIEDDIPLHHDINIDVSHIPHSFFINTNVEENVVFFNDKNEKVAVKIEDDIPLHKRYDDIDFEVQSTFVRTSEEDAKNSDVEDHINPLSRFQNIADETVLISNALPNDSFMTIAPGEDKIPLPVLTDKFCEVLAHPHLFPTGKFDYNVERDVPLSPVKYFNQRLLNYTQRFSSDTDYIFFVHSVLLKLQLNTQINIAMQKICSDSLTAGMLSSNFKERVKEFIASDKAFTFMNSIKGTPAYWQRFLYEVLGMVKQLGLPTFFLTLSCADLRWNELISIISRLKGVDISTDDIENLSYKDRCDLLNSNPVVVARHFQFRVELFFKKILMNGQLGKLKCHAIRVEFQVRGSPHVHAFLWMENPIVLTEETMQQYTQFVESTVNVSLSPQNKTLSSLVKTFQIHKHSKTCRKFKNQNCRFHFGKFFFQAHNSS